MADSPALKQKAALASILASAVITVGKLVAGLLSGSLALMSEAGHAALDTGATIITYFAVRAADKPADDEHQYGHAKIEAVAALAETGFLLVLAASVLIEAARRLLGHSAEAVDANWLAFSVLAASIVIDLVRWRSLHAIATATKSDALAADALHFSSDLIASACVLTGLAATRFGYPQGDALAAFAVALFIAIAGFRLGRRTIDTLIDAAPRGLTERVRKSVLSVGGVAGVDSIRLRPAGATVMGELGITVPRTMPLEGVAAVKEAVAAQLAVAVPENAITITADPVALDDETVLERVLLVSARRRLAVHHVTVQHIGGASAVSLDLELDARMPLGRAHEIASGLEAAIEAELGSGIEVETHIEPLEVQELPGQDAGPEQTAEIAALLERKAREGAILTHIHNVRVRRTANGLVVNYHCGVDPTLSVEAVHDAVDRLDHALRADFSNIVRVVGHAEPVGE
jgi:cation diffusion facilitator family transporter